jgi:hypothetical protein
MNRCRRFVFLLLLPIAMAQTTTPASRPAGWPAAAEARLPALRARVAELEAAFYKEHPTARQVEQHLAELRTTYNANFNRGTAALRTLPDPREAAGFYSMLRGEWSGVIAPETLRDPIVGPVIKALLLSSEAGRQREADRLIAGDPTLRRGDLADPDSLWRTLLTQAETAVPEARRRFNAAVQRANFPDWIVAEAKTDAEYQGKMEMLDTWLNVVTPADLKVARRQLANDENLVRAATRNFAPDAPLP